MGRGTDNTKRGPPAPRKEHETSQPRASTNLRRRGKEVVTNSPDMNEQEDDNIPQLVRTSKATRKSTETSKKKKAPQEKREPTPEEYLKVLKTRTFAQTKWADRETLERLGIHEEVLALATNMGLAQFFFMVEKGYQIPTCEFLSSLEVERDGDFTFVVGRTRHGWNADGLCDLFGFPTNCRNSEIKRRTEEPKSVWASIGVDSFIPGRTKASLIRHPAIRYAHKVLAHSFYARKETGMVKADEMAFLTSGLKPFLQTGEDGRVIQGSLEDVNLGHVLLQYFLELRKTLYFNAKKDSHLAIGGVVTHILRKCKVKFVENDQPVDNLINLAYLSGALIVGGAVQGQIIYNMYIAKKEKVKVLLPNEQLTTLMTRENVLFWPPREALYDPNRHSTVDWVSRMKNKGKAHQVDEDQESEEEEEDEGDEEEETYGSHRYHFKHYDGAVSNEALKRAHEQNKKLQKWNKWQDRTIHKLYKAVKGLSGQVKALKKALTSKKRGEGHSKANEEAAEANEAMEIEEEQRRRSYHGESETTLAIYEPTRHSSYETGTRRQRQRRRLRSPSPISSNPSLSISSEEEDTSGSQQF